MAVLPTRVHRLLLGLTAFGLVLVGSVQVGHVQTPGTFAARIAQLSERPGFFDTDNLISNERSFLHVVPALRAAQLSGGAYIGVGPDQNFSYMAQVKPSIAFIVDLRRDNLLLHLLFKGLFSLSETRVDYLSLLFGRPVPARLDDWRRADLDRIAAYIEGPPLTEPALAALSTRVDATIRGFGVPLSPEDFATINRFHRRFITAGLPLKFETFGRAPQRYYPSYRDLMFETDREGRRWSFLNSEDDFQVVRSLERRDLVIPIVGDLSGPTALVEIGKLMASRNEQLAAFYASNVEFYLFGDGRFAKFIENLSRVPRNNRSLLIRSVFGGMAQPAPGYGSASLVQNVEELVTGYPRGRFRDYRELTVTR